MVFVVQSTGSMHFRCRIITFQTGQYNIISNKQYSTESATSSWVYTESRSEQNHSLLRSKNIIIVFLVTHESQAVRNISLFSKFYMYCFFRFRMASVVYSFFTGFASCMHVIASPLSKILPTSLRFFPISTASSNTMFIYSSKPMICPSSCIFVSSYNQIFTLVFFYISVLSVDWLVQRTFQRIGGAASNKHIIRVR